jgi:hypothetical protein
MAECIAQDGRIDRFQSSKALEYLNRNDDKPSLITVWIPILALVARPLQTSLINSLFAYPTKSVENVSGVIYV